MIRGRCNSIINNRCKITTVEIKTTPEVEEYQPPGTRIPDNVKPNGRHYRPGERLEKQARKYNTWNRSDARATLDRLMTELSI